MAVEPSIRSTCVVWITFTFYLRQEDYCVCLSVCLLTGLQKNCWSDLYEIFVLWLDTVPGPMFRFWLRVNVTRVQRSKCPKKLRITLFKIENRDNKLRCCLFRSLNISP